MEAVTANVFLDLLIARQLLAENSNTVSNLNIMANDKWKPYPETLNTLHMMLSPITQTLTELPSSLSSTFDCWNSRVEGENGPHMLCPHFYTCTAFLHTHACVYVCMHTCMHARTHARACTQRSCSEGGEDTHGTGARVKSDPPCSWATGAWPILGRPRWPYETISQRLLRGPLAPEARMAKGTIHRAVDPWHSPRR